MQGELQISPPLVSTAGSAGALAADTDATMAANSDVRVATQKATKTMITTGTVTMTNKRITQRVVAAADADTFTVDADATDMEKQITTQAGGTLTVVNPTGTPTDGQLLMLRIKSTNAQTFAWGNKFRGGTVALPSATSGSSKTDYFQFIYNAADTKWDFLASRLNF